MKEFNFEKTNQEKRGDIEKSPGEGSWVFLSNYRIPKGKDRKR